MIAQRILFIGDSITDCQRRDTHAPLGCGYVRAVADRLMIRRPKVRYDIINRGVGGQTMRELRERWTDDVLHERPDHLVVMIGINDLCGCVVRNGRGVTPEAYEAMYDAVLQRTRLVVPRCRVLLLTPFYISRDDDPGSIRHAVLRGLPPYRAAVRRLAGRHGVDFIDTHMRFQQLLRHHDAALFCPEPVHPNQTGHQALAEWVFDALFPKGCAGTRHAATPIAGVARRSRPQGRQGGRLS